MTARGVGALGRAAERGFVVVALLLFSEALIPLLRAPTDGAVPTDDSDPLLQAMWLAIYLVPLLLLGIRWRRLAFVAVADAPLLMLVATAVASAAWSTAPDLTLRHGLAAVGTTSFGAYLALRYTHGELLRLLAIALGMATVLSLVFGVVLPSYGISSGLHEGAWRGIYVHKNVLGRVMALSAVVFVLRAAGGRRRWLAWIGAALSTTLLLLSTSTTAVVLLVVLLAVLPLYRALRWRYLVAIPLFLVVLLVAGAAAALFTENADLVFGLLGKDTTLTGRTMLWGVLIHAIGQRPWLGYGFTAFFSGRALEADEVFTATGWMPVHAHNGVLDLALGLGLWGLLLLCVQFPLAFRRAVACMRAGGTAEAMWPLAYLTFMLLYNLSESTVLKQHSLFWVLYAATSASLATRRAAPAPAPASLPPTAAAFPLPDPQWSASRS